MEHDRQLLEPESEIVPTESATDEQQRIGIGSRVVRWFLDGRVNGGSLTWFPARLFTRKTGDGNGRYKESSQPLVAMKESQRIPSEFREAFNSGKLREIVRIDKIITEGKPEQKRVKCRVCNNGTLVYSRGPLAHLSNGKLLLVADLPAFRCDNDDCDASLIFLSEVREELRQRIKEAAVESLISPT